MKTNDLEKKSNEADEQLDFSELESLEGGSIVIGCGKGKGSCTITKEELAELGDAEVN